MAVQGSRLFETEPTYVLLPAPIFYYCSSGRSVRLAMKQLKATTEGHNARQKLKAIAMTPQHG